MTDMILKIIIMTIGLFALIESIAIMIFPQAMLNIAKAWMKHVKHMRKLAIIEFIIALVFVLIAIFFL
jgi:hypothetical protein